MTRASWVAVDWGTSNLRVWAMDAENQPIALRTSDKGMSDLTPAEYPEVLEDLLSDLLPDGPIPVVICGMAGARQGWAEAPYATVPCTPPSLSEAVRIETPRFEVHILPGVSQAGPPDVMRGEETQIAGFMAKHPKFDGVICLPGTHTKWVHVSAGEIVSFQTFMTGEMFALLSKSSVLRHVMQGEDWDAACFDEAVSDAMSRPAAFASRLFGLRADGLLNQTPASQLRARLSGLLIGLELAGARPYWLGQAVALVGAPGLVQLYQAALSAQGAMVQTEIGDELTLAGLIAAKDSLNEAQS